MSDRDLIVSLADLARSAPRQWNTFLAAYRVHNNKLINDLISSPSELLQLSQGRAVQGREFLKILETCTSEADKLQRKNQ